MPKAKMGLVELEPDQGKLGSSGINALASGARGLKFHPHSRRGKVSMSEHVFLSVMSHLQ